MNRAIALLLAIFAVQSALTAYLYWPDSGPEIMASVPLAQFDPKAIDEIHIDDGQGNQAVLLRVENRWSVPELQDLPADETKIQALLQVVLSNAHGAPVADTIAARQRFRVASYHYQRRVTFISQGEPRDTVYLGTSPGFRRVHARNDTTDAIYTVPFNTFDAPANQDDWVERSILQVDTPDLIKGPGFQLVRDGLSWINQNGGLPEARELDALLRALASLQIDGVADEDSQRSISELEPDLTLKLTVAMRQINLEFFALEDGRYILSSEYPVFFELAAYAYDRILGFDPALLRGTSATLDSLGNDPGIDSEANAAMTKVEEPK